LLLGTHVLAQAPKIAPMHVHHVHLSSVNPAAAAAYYPKPFAATATKTTFNGYEAVKTGNLYLLFTKVAMPPQNELTGPQTSVWHFGWNTPDSRKYDERFRALQREKYRAAVPLLAAFRAAPGALALDAGAGTALFAEWIADAREPHAHQRASLSSLRWVAADLSAGMLQLARRRAVLPLVCDLVCLPLHDRCCSLAVSFTSVLEEKPEALRELGLGMIQVVKTGYGKQVLEVKDFVTLARHENI